MPRSATSCRSFPPAGYNLRRIRSPRGDARGRRPDPRADVASARPRRHSMAFLENMSRNPITSAEWKTYEIETDVPEDVSRIVFGVMLFGPGKAWVDDVSLDILGEIIKDKVEPARPLTAQGLTNLTASRGSTAMCASSIPAIRRRVPIGRPSPSRACAKWKDAADATELDGAAPRDLPADRAHRPDLGGETAREPLPCGRAGVPAVSGTWAFETADQRRDVHATGAERERNPPRGGSCLSRSRPSSSRASRPRCRWRCSRMRKARCPHAGPAAAPPLYERSAEDRGNAARRGDHRVECLPALLSLLRRREDRLARRVAEGSAQRRDRRRNGEASPRRCSGWWPRCTTATAAWGRRESRPYAAAADHAWIGSKTSSS